MRGLNTGKEPVSAGLRGGEAMTLEIRDLSDSSQCSRKEGSFHQLSSIVKPTCLEWVVLKISLF